MSTATKKSNLGGFREGAGRKPLYDEPLKRQVVLLTTKEIRHAKKVGEGQGVSAGIRTIISKFEELNGESVLPEYDLPDGNKKRTSVALSQDQIEILNRVGSGKPRTGVRILLAGSMAGEL